MAAIDNKTVRGGTTIANVAKAAAAVAAGAAAAAGLSKLLNKPTQTSGIGLQFPEDLVAPESGRNYYMTFRFENYRRRSIFDRSSFVATGDSIILPIPNNLVDTQAVSWGDEKADPAVGAAIEGALNGGGGVNSLLQAATGALEGGAIQGAQKLAGVINSATGVNIPVDQILQMNGYAVNPFMTVLFQSPAFKTHTFSWKLAPNNRNESENLRQIVSMFRRHMLPGLSGSNGGTLLSYPDIVQINLFPDEEYLYKFKPCVIENMSVNFAPNSGPSFFKQSNAPTEIQFSIQLKEIEYWVQSDVENFYGRG